MASAALRAGARAIESPIAQEAAKVITKGAVEIAKAKLADFQSKPGQANPHNLLRSLSLNSGISRGSVNRRRSHPSEGKDGPDLRTASEPMADKRQAPVDADRKDQVLPEAPLTPEPAEYASDTSGSGQATPTSQSSTAGSPPLTPHSPSLASEQGDPLGVPSDRHGASIPTRETEAPSVSSLGGAARPGEAEPGHADVAAAFENDLEAHAPDASGDERRDAAGKLATEFQDAGLHETPESNGEFNNKMSDSAMYEKHMKSYESHSVTMAERQMKMSMLQMRVEFAMKIIEMMASTTKKGIDGMKVQ